MTEEADVVIVGAGHNGMAAAGYLSRAGKRVIVVERLGKVGGMTSAGYMIPEAPAISSRLARSNCCSFAAAG